MYDQEKTYSVGLLCSNEPLAFTDERIRIGEEQRCYYSRESGQLQRPRYGIAGASDSGYTDNTLLVNCYAYNVSISFIVSIITMRRH